MRILVTGSSGFIGRHLTEELIASGHKVFGADKNTQRVRLVAENQLTPILSYEGDLSQTGVFKDILEEVNPHRVVHLAAQVGRLFGEEDIVHTINSNATMTALIAKSCGEAGVPITYASTSEIYGDNGNAICHEFEGPFTLPHNLYGVSKFWGEEVINLYAPENAQFLRLSMPYGTGVPPGRGRAALNNVVWQACTGQDIPIHEGSARSWCWVGDTVRGIRLIIESNEPGPFNVGRDDAEISMLDLAHKAVEITGAHPNQIKIIPAPVAQTVVKRLATDRLRALGWEPTVELDEGILHVQNWVINFDIEGNFVMD